MPNGAKTILANKRGRVSLKRKVANQEFRRSEPDGGHIRAGAASRANPVARGEDWYSPQGGGASADLVSFETDRPVARPEFWRKRQVFMRPALEKQKQLPSKKIPGKRTPTLQIELELPRVPADELVERAPLPEPPERGVAIVDFYV